MAGTSIRIFLVDGTTSGLRTAEIGLSTIKVLLCPRGALPALGKREESGHTGVYVLVGDDPDIPGRLAVYVGEGDNVYDRLLIHNQDPEKEFWDRALVFTSKDENLTKAHGRHLESRLVELATEAKRCTVTNKTKPAGGMLPEPDLADMNTFVSQIRLLSAALGVPAFEPTALQAPPVNAEASGVISLSMNGQGYRASCRLIDGEFVVLKGSAARATTTPTLLRTYINAREELEKSGDLQRTSDELRFTQDYGFQSATGAACVIAGSSISGKAAWRLPNGETLGAMEAARTGSEG